MSSDREAKVTIEDRDLGAGWHLKAVVVIGAVLAVAYVVAVNVVLK